MGDFLLWPLIKIVWEQKIESRNRLVSFAMSLGHPIVEVVVEGGLRSLWEGLTGDCSTVMGKEPSLSPKLDFPRFPPALVCFLRVSVQGLNAVNRASLRLVGHDCEKVYAMLWLLLSALCTIFKNSKNSICYSVWKVLWKETSYGPCGIWAWMVTDELCLISS